MDQMGTGRHPRRSRKLPGVALDTPDHLMELGGHVEEQRQGDEDLRRNGEATRVRGEGLSAEGEESGSLEMEDLPPSCRMISGHQYDSKSSRRHQDDPATPTQHFRKNTFGDMSHCRDEDMNTTFPGHHPLPSLLSPLTTATSQGTTISPTSNMATTSKTTSTTIPTSSTAYQIPSRKENLRDHTIDGSSKDIEMTEMTSPISHYLASSNHHHVAMKDIPHLVHGRQDFQAIPQCSTTFNLTDSYPPRQNSDQHHRDFDRHLPLLDGTKQANQMRDLSIRRGQSIPRTSDHDLSLDREPQHLYRQLTRDPSLLSLDQYSMTLLGASSNNTTTVSNTTQTFPSVQKIPHRLSIYPARHHRFHLDENIDHPLTAMSTSTNIHATQQSLDPQIDNIFNLKPTPQEPEILDQQYLPSYQRDMKANTLLTRKNRPSNWQDFKMSIDQIQMPFDLTMYNQIDRPHLPKHYSMMNLNQSLQDLRPGNKLIGSHIGSKFPKSGYLSRSVTRLVSRPGIGDYVSCDQLLTGIRRQYIEDELFALHQKRKHFLDDDEDDFDSLSCSDSNIEDRRINRLHGDNWQDSRYSSAEELTKRGYLRAETKRIIRHLIEDKLGLTDQEHTITDDETRRVVHGITQRYDDDYILRIDKDRFVDEEIRRLDDDIKKADILHYLQNTEHFNLGEVMLSKNSTIFDDKCVGKENQLVNAVETRGRDRVRRYSRRGVSSVSPRRFSSADRDRLVSCGANL